MINLLGINGFGKQCWQRADIFHHKCESYHSLLCVVHLSRMYEVSGHWNTIPIWKEIIHEKQTHHNNRSSKTQRHRVRLQSTTCTRNFQNFHSSFHSTFEISILHSTAHFLCALCIYWRDFVYNTLHSTSHFCVNLLTWFLHHHIYTFSFVTSSKTYIINVFIFGRGLKHTPPCPSLSPSYVSTSKTVKTYYSSTHHPPLCRLFPRRPPGFPLIPPTWPPPLHRATC